MASSLVFSNNEMFVGIDEHAELISLFFPYVGSEQHSAFPRLNHKIGVWVDGEMSWLSSGEWRFSYDYQPQSLVGDIRAHNDRLHISLEFSDAVSSGINAFVRNIHVVNNADHEREIRLFMHQAFQIGQSTDAETAYYSPDDDTLIHYKGRRVFMIGSQSSQRASFDQYAIGKSDSESNEGTWRDAEDGELQENTVQMGSIDSTMRLKLNIPGLSSDRIFYWIAAGQSLREARSVSMRVRQEGVMGLQISTALWWKKWLNPAEAVSKRLPKIHSKALEQSLMIAKAHCDKRGAVIASLDVSPLSYTDDAYAYSWARDAAYIIWPLIRLGFRDEPKRYFEYVKKILDPSGYISHKHTVDGALGPSWHSYTDGKQSKLPIQTDETASVLFMIGQYVERFNDLEYLKSEYINLVSPMADFLVKYTYEDGLPMPSYDIWEQMYMTSAYTTSVTYGALIAAGRLAEKLGKSADAERWFDAAAKISDAAKVFLNDRTGYIHRGFYTGPNSIRHFDDTPDISSVYGMFMYGLIEPNSHVAKRTVKAMHDLLQSVRGGETYIRFVGDSYRSSGQDSNIWIVPTLWVAQMNIEITNHIDSARAIDWVLKLDERTPFLPEQVDPHSLESTLISPLVWSHAELINTLLDYTVGNPEVS